MSTITGTYGADTLKGGMGDDEITGLEGADNIDGQAGADTIDGGAGNDTIKGSFGDDSLLGGSGNDSITDDQGSNVLDGGEGNDSLTSRSLSGIHTLIGGSGADNLTATGQTVVLEGGTENDSLNAIGSFNSNGETSFLADGKATLDGGAGRDYVDVSNYNASIIDGGTGDDEIVVNNDLWGNNSGGHAKNSTTSISGGEGNDYASVDYHKIALLHGDAGDDRLYTNKVQSSTLNGGSGSDQLSANVQNNYTNYTSGDHSAGVQASLDGGEGNDKLTVRGTAYNSYGRVDITANGGAGNDVITVTSNGAGTTKLTGSNRGYASVEIDGGDGADKIRVSGGLQVNIKTGDGSDTVELTAQQYRTILEGSRSITTDGGTSTVSADPIVISDFTTGKGGDILDYGDLLKNGTSHYNGLNPFTEGFIVLEQSGDDTLVRFDADGSSGTGSAVILAVLKSTSVSALVADNFSPNHSPTGDEIAAQTITGTYGADTLKGGMGDDEITGLEGADNIDGQAGADTIDGGAGNDTIKGSFGDDSLLGGSGNDSITDDQGSNVLDGGEGNDSLTSRSLSGIHTLIGGSGADNLTATGQTVVLEGGTENDSLNAIGSFNSNGETSFLADGKATLDGGAGRDYVDVSNYNASIIDGGTGDDEIVVNNDLWGNNSGGHAKNSTTSISGGEGNDYASVDYHKIALLHGDAGDDHLYTNKVQSSTLNGGSGSDQLSANVQNNYTNYTSGDHSAGVQASLDGGEGNDKLTVRGTAYNSYGRVDITANGGAGNDVITVTSNGAGTTKLTGSNRGYASVEIDGGDGADKIRVSGGLQVNIKTGDGSDTVELTAQQYRTILEGSRSITTDGGTSTVSADPIVISDFTTGKGGDILDYGDLLKNGTSHYNGLNPFTEGFIVLEQSGDDTLVRFDADGSSGTGSAVILAVLKSTSVSALVADNFSPNHSPTGDEIAAQTITGTYGADTLKGGMGDDEITGLEGADNIDGQAGADTIDGGAGNDTIKGSFGDDSLLGGSGNDSITDDQGSNVLDGGEGNDSLTSRSLSGIHTLIGGSGADNLTATGQTVVLEGGTENDSLNAIGSFNSNGETSFLADGKATLDGGAGRDYVDVSNYNASIIDGGTGDDEIVVNNDLWGNNSGGHAKNSTTSISGGEGNDYASVDYHKIALLHGDAGDDRLYTNKVQSSTLNGGSGSDQLSANVQNNYTNYTSGDHSAGVQASLDGGEGNDKLTVRGTAYNSYGRVDITANGGAGNDVITVTSNGAGTTKLTGSNRGYASVEIDGGDGADKIRVSGGLQVNIKTGDGSDTVELTAQQYRTILEGSRSITTDGGTSTVSADPIVISDFTTGKGGDILDYGDLLKNGTSHYNGLNPFTEGFIVLEQSGDDTLVRFDADGSSGTGSAVILAVLKSTSVSALVADNFSPNFDPPATEIKNGVASIEFSEDPVTIGGVEQMITATVAFGSEVSDTTVAGLHLYSPNDNAKLFLSNISITDGQATVPISLNQWAAAGEWRIAEVNTTTSEGEFEVEYEQELIEKSVDTRLLVKNENGDNAKPLISSIEGYQDAVAGFGDIVIKVAFSDELSGLSSIGLQINPSGSDLKYFGSVSSQQISNGTATFVLTPELLGNFGIDVATGDFDGAWDILEVSATDHAGNSSVYYADELNDKNFNTSFDFELNAAPDPSGKAIRLSSKEDTSITIATDDLLEGWSDPNGDTLSVSSLSTTSSNGKLVDNKNGTWTYTPAVNFNGDIPFAYSVTDGSFFVDAEVSLNIKPVNDAPVVSGSVDLGVINQDEALKITSKQLLATSLDPDGDDLVVLELKVPEEQGAIVPKGDGSWLFTPSSEWVDKVRFTYRVSDGSSSTGIIDQNLDQWSLIAHMSNKGGMFDGNGNLASDYSFGTFKGNPKPSTKDFQIAHPFESKDKEILFVTGDKKIWASTDYEDLLSVVNANAADFSENISFNTLIDGIDSVSQGNVLSRKNTKEDPWISIDGDHQNGISNGRIIWGENNYSAGDHQRLKNTHKGVNVYIRDKSQDPDSVRAIAELLVNPTEDFELVDEDGNGIADGSELSAYQLMSEAGAVTLQNKAGKTYSHGTTKAWDAVVAVKKGEGFQVLLAGAGSRDDQFNVWTTNSDGVIRKGSGWKSADQATGLGWEETFSYDTNGDGIIGDLVDEDGNGIADGSELSAYQLMSEAGAVTLQNKAGKTYSHGTTKAWDAVVAVKNGEGFQVLLEGTGSRNDQFLVWTTNSKGVISKGSGWKSADQATGLGWEDTFSYDTNGDGTIGALVDEDGNGIADGSELSAYQLMSEAGAVTLQNKAGKTYSHGTTKTWDAVVAVKKGEGFQVLLEGAGSRDDQFNVWTTNSDGVITKGSGWKSADQATGLGWEETFSYDTNGDGTIGALVDEDGNGIADGSELSAYQLMSEAGAVILQNKAGKTYNHSTTKAWDAVVAVKKGEGFQVLLEGAGSRDDQFNVWTTNSDGVIRKGSGWKSADQATGLGWEETFSYDTNGDGTIGALVDEDGNGIADGSELSAYQLMSEAGAVTLQNKAGKTYNHSTTKAWDAVVAVKKGEGFQVLLAGAGSRDDQFNVWSTNSDGVIRKGSGWKSADQATGLGWEETFSYDTNGDGTIGALVDEDGNGIADGSELSAYQLMSEAGAVTLQNKAGKTYSHGTTKAWDAVVAVKKGEGFQVLLEGAGSRDDQFNVWTTNSDGVIRKGSGWKSADQATGLGWEETFSYDTNGDGIIGSLVDEDGNGIADGSELSAYQLMSEVGAVTLQNSNGGTYSDSYTGKWDARAAAQVDGGFKVLLEGTNDLYRDQFIVWSTDFSGTIINSTGWKTGEELADQGMEALFGIDLNADGLV